MSSPATEPRIERGMVVLVAAVGAYIALQLFDAGVSYERERQRTQPPGKGGGGVAGPAVPAPAAPDFEQLHERLDAAEGAPDVAGP